MLVLEGVTRKFNDHAAVSGVSLAVEPGSFVGILGPSGAGKSTLLRMINRLVDPSDGCISFDGNEITKLRGKQLRHWRARCAMIFQQFNLIGRADVMTNVMMGLLNRGPLRRSLLLLWTEEEKAAALLALEQFDMAHLAASRTDHLSGGQQQRVAIARALVQEPSIILADEPIASLDPRNSQAVMSALAHINKQYGITVLCNLHALDIAQKYCDRLVGMKAGQVVFDSAPSALTRRIAQDLYGGAAEEMLDLHLPSHKDHDFGQIVVPHPATGPVFVPSSTV